MNKIKMGRAHQKWAEHEATQYCKKNKLPIHGVEWKKIFKMYCEEALNESLTPKILAENRRGGDKNVMDFILAENPTIMPLRGSGENPNLFKLTEKKTGIIDSSSMSEKEKKKFLDDLSSIASSIARLSFEDDFKKLEDFKKNMVLSSNEQIGIEARSLAVTVKYMEIYYNIIIVSFLENLFNNKKLIAEKVKSSLPVTMELSNAYVKAMSGVKNRNSFAERVYREVQGQLSLLPKGIMD